MPTTTRAQISSRIKTILQAIDPLIIGQVFGYLESKPTTFPAVMLKYGGSTTEMLDTNHNLVTYVFDVLIIFPNADDEDAQGKWQVAYDTVINALNDIDNQTLSGDAVSFMVEGDDRPAFTDQFSTKVAVLGVRTRTKVVQSI